MPLLHNIAVSGSVAKSLVLYFLPVGAVFPWVEASIYSSLVAPIYSVQCGNEFAFDNIPFYSFHKLNLCNVIVYQI